MQSVHEQVEFPGGPINVACMLTKYMHPMQSLYIYMNISNHAVFGGGMLYNENWQIKQYQFKVLGLS